MTRYRARVIAAEELVIEAIAGEDAIAMDPIVDATSGK